MNVMLISLIKRYQENISPKLQERGVRCLFKQSCSHYAVDKLKNNNIFLAIIFIFYRLLSCNPINAYFKQKDLANKIASLTYGKRI